MEGEDKEITLGTGRLLGLFFGLVVICALFFSAGFSLGRRSAPDTVSAANFGVPASAAPGSKPAAGRTDSVAKPDASPKSGSDELTFYKAVEQSDPKAKLEPAAAANVRPGTNSAENNAAPPPEMSAPVALASGYMVQVAAVSKEEDAEALVNALRRKSYPVITTDGPNDKLYHVQVGPFAELKDAEATRSKLIGDGYSPIVKK